jgi:hypothetical protein
MARQPSEAALVMDFAHAMHRVRYQAGKPSYCSVGKLVHASASTLQRVQSGKGGAPSLNSTLRFIEAHGGDEPWWRGQHRDLMSGLRRRTPVGPFYPGPQVEFVIEAFGSVHDLAIDMDRLREQSGMTLARIEERTADDDIVKMTDVKRISLKTLSDMCNSHKGSLPLPQTLIGFLMAIGIPEEDIKAMVSVRDQLSANRRSSSPECMCF